MPGTSRRTLATAALRNRRSYPGSRHIASAAPRSPISMGMAIPTWRCFTVDEAGFYEYARDDAAWAGFQTIDALPHLEAAGRSAQWSDLSGDGRADLFVANDGRLTWYPSDGKGGFDPQVEVQQDIAEPGALAICEDLTLDLFFADMNGDGLVDQVRVRNGRVEYWPHLGNGRFGDPILMEGSPTFAPDGQFDSARVLLVDLDGNGAADVVYVGHGDCRTDQHPTSRWITRHFSLVHLPA